MKFVAGPFSCKINLSTALLSLAASKPSEIAAVPPLIDTFLSGVYPLMGIRVHRSPNVRASK
jgi:hypothetical protein